MDSAAGNDENIRVLSDIEIIIYKVVYTGLGDNNRNVNALVFCSGFYGNINTRLVLFRNNGNIFST